MSTGDEPLDAEDGVVGLEIVAEPVRGSKKLHRLKVRYEGSLIHTDAIDLFEAAARSRFARAVVGKVDGKIRPGAVTVADVEDLLLTEADKLEDAEAAAPADGPEDAGAEGRPPAGAEYRAVISADDPDRHGLFQLRGDQRERLTNFTMTVERDVRVEDDVQHERRFEGSIGLGGEDHPFAIAAGDFADDRKLQATIFSAAGPKARLLGKPALIRDAVSAVSEPETVRRTTAFGWNADGSAYLSPGGLVDRDGFRPYGDGELRADPGTEGPHRWLGLRGLTPEELTGARRHLVEDFYRLHGRAVMATLLGAVALAALERHAGNPQRVAIWLKGLTGAGKSFPAKLAMGFFGDFDPRQGERFVSWASTANFIPQAGYYFRDALYLVDDFKPEVIQAGQAVRILQTYADTAGRGRLQADARANVTRPIRGLLISTGEDLPQNNASALARTIIVEVPNLPKDQGRAARCLEMWPLYRGVMADFLRWTIAEGRAAGFAGRVRRRSERFYERISGRPNDARIAGNFGLLAAAFAEFSRYLGDAWPGREAESRAYLEEDLPAMRDRMLGLAVQQQASVIFLETLRDLLDFKKVRFEGDRQAFVERDGESTRVRDFKAQVIGKVVGDDALAMSLPMAMAEVQEHLRRQGREEIKASPSTLQEQLTADGVLMPHEKVRDGKPRNQYRFADKHPRCVLLRRAALEAGEERGGP
jgi:hypothetical protein